MIVGVDFGAPQRARDQRRKIIHAEGACRPVLAPDLVWPEPLLKEWEGAIWVPTIASTPP